MGVFEARETWLAGNVLHSRRNRKADGAPCRNILFQLFYMGLRPREPPLAYGTIGHVTSFDM